MIQIHSSICPDHQLHPPVIQLSLDGIQESKSSTNSLDIFSVKFNGCRNIYPISIVRPCERFKYDEQAEMKRVLADINANGLTIDCCVFDNPKRSNMRCAKSACAKYPCEFCEHCAVTFIQSNKTSSVIGKRYEIQERHLSQEISQLQDTQENESDNEDLENLRQMQSDLAKDKKNELSKSGRKLLTWPASTMDGNLRTLDAIRAISNEIEANPDIVKTDPDFCKGIKGKSLFLDQPSFHLVNDMPPEYMHSVCIGVTRRMLELTFRVGENRDRVTKRKLSNPKTFNDKIKSIQLPRESSRRCRNLDLGVMKASEYRNVLIYFFLIVIDCIEDEFEEEKQIWLHLAFMIRACILPNDEYTNVDKEQLKSACRKFYELYEKVYGQKNCTYSIHVVGSHLFQIRGKRPLTSKSAFKFESFFSEVRNLFHAGTVSPLKQILQNCYMKRLLEFHCCEKKTFFSAEKKPKPGKKFNPGQENNSLIYTYNEENVLDIFVIDEIIDENNFNCKIQGKFPLKLQLTPEYNWNEVGVFKMGPISEEKVVVKRSAIRGKVIKLDGYLITCPNNVIHEQ